MNIGIFGGRFDPIHYGHTALASAAAERYELERVLFVPANVPPHKQRTHADFIHRYAMVTLATQDDWRFVPSLLEAPGTGAEVPSAGEAMEAGGARAGAGANYSGVNYSIDTVRRVKRALKDPDRLFFLIGMDAFMDIGKWHEAAALFAECEFVVASRLGHSLRYVEKSLPEELRPPGAVTRPLYLERTKRDLILPGVTVHLLDCVHAKISATTIRAAAAQGRVLPRSLDSRVTDYIRKNGLYRWGSKEA